MDRLAVRQSTWSLLLSCLVWILPSPETGLAQHSDDPFLTVLGIAQDAGIPHAGCRKACCNDRWSDSAPRVYATCLGMVDPATGQRWLFEATPDFPHQLEMLNRLAPVVETEANSAAVQRQPALAGIFLTHAHIGHYSGLMYLGRESLGARDVPVHVMPRMRSFLRENGPWNQLVALKNIRLVPLTADVPIAANEQIRVRPLLVPHRDEFSETVGFIIRGPRQAVLFLPDIDKWDVWNRSIEDVIASVDVALIDGTFFDSNELPHRDLKEIPHPVISESLKRFQSLPDSERHKIRFIHLNHTNPAVRIGSHEAQAIKAAGMGVAQQGDKIDL